MATLLIESRGKLDVYYEEEGTGEPLVMVGGLTATVEVWGKLRGLLAAHCRLIMPDNRGTGRTKAYADDGDRAPARMAEDLLGLVEGLGLDSFHLMGGSYGGMIALSFAVKHPGRLRSLIVACSHFGGSEKVTSAPGVRETRARGGTPDATEVERRAALETLFHPETIDESPEVVAFYDGFKRRFPIGKEEIERRSQGVAEFDVSEEIRNLRVPTLVISGEADVLVPTENSRLMASRIPGAELVIIENTGHHFYSERPEASAKRILAFLSRNTS